MPKTYPPIVIYLDMERETPNTVRFAARGDKDSQAMGKAYVKKQDLEKLGNPKAIKLTIEAA